MKTPSVYLFTLALFAFSIDLFGQGTAFTYQGRLNNGANPANGAYDFQFRVAADSAGNTHVGSPFTAPDVAVSNGLFTVAMDFGAGIFNGSNYWLQIAVRTNGAASFISLTPLQPLTPSPYAIFANTASNVSGTVSSANLSGTYGNQVILNNANNSFTGAFTGNGGNVTNVNAAALGGLGVSNFWKLGGNAGANPTNGAFFGTADNLPLELKANSQRALRLEPNTNGSPNVLAGSPVNFAAPTVIGAVISGGGATNFLGSVLPNSIAANFSFVGGGYLNAVQTNSPFSTIGGGRQNTIQTNAEASIIGGGDVNTIQIGATESVIAGGGANFIGTNVMHGVIGGGEGNRIMDNAQYSVVGGGADNFVLSNAQFSVIGGGNDNTIQTNSYQATIGGGNQNVIQTNSFNSTIAGGNQNTVGPNAFNSTVGGGSQNVIDRDSFDSTISGGFNNIIDADGDDNTIGGGSNNYIGVLIGFATVAGGQGNEAFNAFATVSGGFSNVVGGFAAMVPGGQNNLAKGDYSFAAGQNAQALSFGDFVWSDADLVPFISTGPDQFLIRANGGVGIGTNAPSAQLHVASPGGTTMPQMQITQLNPNDTMRLRMNVADWPGSPFWEMDVSPSATPALQWWNTSLRMQLDYNGNLTTTGTVNGTSDRNAKEKFTTISSRDVLDKVAALPISEWNFKHEPDIRHIGPMAQDFYAAFNVGMDNKHIAMVDEEGVALAAIQGLNQKLDAKDAEIQDLKQTVAELKKMMQSLAEKSQR